MEKKLFSRFSTELTRQLLFHSVAFLCDKKYICENEMISMSRTWDEEKNVRIRTYDLLNTRRALYPLSYGELMESEAIY